MKISIVTICFNNEKDIRPTLESVINQTYQDIEYIIVDGKSKDNTLRIVNEYKQYIHKIISEPDEGLYDAINKGIKNATGDIVGLIHAGDRLYANKVIAKIAAHFEKNDVDISYGNSVMTDVDDKVRFVHKGGKYKKWKIRFGWFPAHQSIYIRREVFEKAGNYDLRFHPFSDYELFLRLFYFDTDKYQLKIIGINEFIHKFSLGGISTKGNIKVLKLQKIYLNCWKAHHVKPPLFIVPMKFFRRFNMFLQRILIIKKW
jgi:glycosyltransferase